MSRTSKALKRLGVAGIAVATIGAGVPALVASSASAAAGGATTTSQLVISPLSQTGAAGTCLLYKVTPLNSTNERPGDTPTITVQLTENPVSDTQDVDFCTVTGTATVRGTDTTTMSERPSYVNGLSTPSREWYDPTGTNVSPAPGATVPDSTLAAGNNPDSASGASGQATATNTNPAGKDSARFTGQNDGVTAATVPQPNDGSVVFGVVGAIAGGANITAFIDTGANDYVRQAAEITANQDATATFTGGNTAEAVTVVDAEPETGSAPINSTITYTVTLKNSAGNTVSGVKPVAEITAGPDAAQTSPALAAQTVTCGTTDNAGTTTCSYTTRSTTGTDTIRTFVNQICGTSAAFQTCEPNDEITRTVAPATSSARNISITPRDVTTPAGTTRVFSATVKDVNGTPVPDVEVQFFENGAGRFVGPDSPTCDCLTTATGADGVATATVTSATAETGTEEVSAFISGIGQRDATGKFTRTAGSTKSSTQCEQLKGAGAGASSTTTAGNCSDATTNTFVTAASPSATPTATTSPGTCPGAQSNLPVRVNTPTINATGLASVTVTGAPANGTIEVQGYSQNHYMTANFNNDPTPIDRTVTAGSDGSATISDLRPASNTRLRARVKGCAFTGLGSVINVRAQETLAARRIATRTVVISGNSIPARPGGLIIGIYRGNTLIGQSRASQTSGQYSVTLKFPASDQGQRINLTARTGQDAQNAPGQSNTRSLLIT